MRWALPLAVAGAYLLTRLFHLGLLPMVSDEGTYITWGVRALHAQGLSDWLASLEDGKQPLLAWLMPPFLALLPDRLVAGRLVSVLCGLANVLLLVRLGRRLYTPAVGWVAAALYVVVPIALIHDRMALYDSLVATTALLVLWATLAWAERPDWRRSLGLGAAMGIALLTKLSALFFVALVPVVVLVWRPRSLRRWWELAQACFIAGAIYSVLYLSPIVDNIQDGNFQRYSLTVGEVLQFPWAVWWKNASFMYEAATSYLGVPLVVLLAGAAVWALVSALLAPVRVRAIVGRGTSPRATAALAGDLRLLEHRSDWVLLVWAGVPLLAFVLTAKIIYSRYVVFCFVIALVLAATTLVRLWHAASAVVPSRARDPDRLPTLRWVHRCAAWWQQRVPRFARNDRGTAQARDLARVGRGAAVLCGVAVVLAVLPFDGALLTQPARAAWMSDSRFITDRFQYVESNYAGYGLPELVGYLRQQAREQPVVVMTRSSTGMPRDGVTAYLLDWPGVQFAVASEQESIQDRLQRQPDAAYALAAHGADVYYVLTDAPGGEQERRFRALNPDLSPVLEAMKPGGQSRFQLYRARLMQSDVTWLDPAPRLGGQIALEGFRLSASTASPGETVRLTLFWQATGRPDLDYTVFTHVEDARGTIVGQKDSQPDGGRRPTSTWRRGDVIGDVYDLEIKPDAPAGAYDLLVGMYDLATGRRLGVTGSAGTAADRVNLGKLTVLTA